MNVLGTSSFLFFSLCKAYPNPHHDLQALKESESRVLDLRFVCWSTPLLSQSLDCFTSSFISGSISGFPLASRPFVLRKSKDLPWTWYHFRLRQAPPSSESQIELAFTKCQTSSIDSLMASAVRQIGDSSGTNLRKNICHDDVDSLKMD